MIFHIESESLITSTGSSTELKRAYYITAERYLEYGLNHIFVLQVQQEPRV